MTWVPSLTLTMGIICFSYGQLNIPRTVHDTFDDRNAPFLAIQNCFLEVHNDNGFQIYNVKHTLLYSFIKMMNRTR